MSKQPPRRTRRPLVPKVVDAETFRQRSCATKHSYPTFAQASDAGIMRMATGSGVPLYVYPCYFCPGFHLTSTDTWDSTVTLTPLVAATSAQETAARMTVTSRGRSVAATAAWRHGKRVRQARGRRDQDTDARIDVVLPRPRVASDDEIEAFFADPVNARA